MPLFDDLRKNLNKISDEARKRREQEKIKYEKEQFGYSEKDTSDEGIIEQYKNKLPPMTVGQGSAQKEKAERERLLEAARAAGKNDKEIADMLRVAGGSDEEIKATLDSKDILGGTRRIPGMPINQEPMSVVDPELPKNIHGDMRGGGVGSGAGASKGAGKRDAVSVSRSGPSMPSTLSGVINRLRKTGIKPTEKEFEEEFEQMPEGFQDSSDIMFEKQFEYDTKRGLLTGELNQLMKEREELTQGSGLMGTPYESLLDPGFNKKVAALDNQINKISNEIESLDSSFDPINMKKDALQQEYDQLMAIPTKNRTLGQSTRLSKVNMELQALNERAKQAKIAEEQELQQIGYDEFVRTQQRNREVMLDDISSARQTLEKQINQYKDMEIGDIRSEVLWGKEGSKNRGWRIAGTLLGGALGAVSQAIKMMAGNENAQNSFFKAVDARVNEELARQRLQLSKARGEIDLTQNLLGQMYKEYGNWEQAQSAAKRIILEQNAMDIDRIERSFKDEDIRLASQSLKNKFDMESRKQELDFLKAQQQQTLSKLATMGQLAAQRASVAARIAQARRQSAGQSINEARKRGKDALKDLADLISGWKMTESLEKGHKALRDDSWGAAVRYIKKWVPTTEEIGWKDTAAQYAKRLSKKIEGSRPSDMDFKVYNERFVPEADDSAERAQNKIDTMRQHIANELKTVLQNLRIAGINIEEDQLVLNMLSDPDAKKILNWGKQQNAAADVKAKYGARRK